jgi:hypothetical protein
MELDLIQTELGGWRSPIAVSSPSGMTGLRSVGETPLTKTGSDS